MIKKVIVFMIMWLIVCLGNANAVQQMLPFPGGETWICTQGNHDDPLAPNVTHTLEKGMGYAWDFAFIGCFGEEVVASAAGEIVRIVLEANSGGWGNTIIIDYGDNTYGKIAHLESIDVNVGNYVIQGQQIGTCGGTGGWVPHIHYQTQSNNSLNGESIPSLFVDVAENDGVPLEGYYYTSNNYLHHQVLKFSDSSDCYLQSNGQLWPISSEQVYAYLGFSHADCNFVANWDYLTELDASQRGNYVIRQETILSLSNPSIGKNIAYKVVEKVGQYVCSSMYVDPTKIYLFGDDNKFHHIANEQVYYDLGYSDDWDDVVEISPDLFMLYGESYAINNTGDALWISSSYAVSVPLSSNNWTYRVGHAFSDSIFGGGENAIIKYQGQEVSLLQAISNGWIYYKAYCDDGVSFYDFEIAYGQFAPGNQYFIYSFVSDAEFTLYGSFESVDDRQAVEDMDNVAESDSRFLFKELYSLEIVPDWSPYWTLRVMAYQVSPFCHAWFNHATSVSDTSVRYVTYLDPDTGQWTNWQRVY